MAENAPVVPVPTTVTLTADLDEQGRKLSPPRRWTLRVTAGVADTFADATRFARGDIVLTFDTLLQALLVERDEFCEWLRDEFKHQGATPPKTEAMGSAASSGAYSTSISARRLLDKAAELASDIEHTDVIATRHLVAAFPVIRGYHDDDFTRMGIDRTAWCRSFGELLARKMPQQRAWLAYADTLTPSVGARFDADVANGRDLLDLDRNVDALSMLIASADTTTPLSVGVFGPWGSGKSFFMRMMKKRIADIAREQRVADKEWQRRRTAKEATASDAPKFYGQIAQVEFNAWHYNEANLVASLVDHVLRNLTVDEERDDEHLEARKTSVHLQLKGAIAQAETAQQQLDEAKKQKEDAKARLRAAEQEAELARNGLASDQQKLAERAAELTAARERIDTAIKETLKPTTPDLVRALGDAALAAILKEVPSERRQQLVDIEREADSLASFVRRILTGRGLVVLILLVVGPALAWLAKIFSTQITALAASAGTALAVLLGALDQIASRRRAIEDMLKEQEAKDEKARKDAQDALTKQRETLAKQIESEQESARDELESRQREVRERETALEQAADAVAAHTTAIDAAAAARAAAHTAIVDATEKLQRLSSAVLLHEFLRELAASDEYRKQLGLFALVRRDFEQLSKLIARSNKDWRAPHKEGQPPLLHRIVLYIDDLDRCSEETVVSVLQVVHLLLAFPLFVCVVAVDPTWVQRCLRGRYKDLLQGASQQDGDAPLASAADYLEKIFQIPIWMDPIDETGRSSVVRALLRPGAPAEQTSTGEERTSESRPSGVNLRGSETRTASPRNGAPRAALPDPLAVSELELGYVDSLRAVLSTRPRSLKRFANTYRLLKASLPSVVLENFVTAESDSPHRACLAQLALICGQHNVSKAVLAAFAAADRSMTLGDFLTDHPDKEVRAAGAKLLAAKSSGIGDMPMGVFSDWIKETSRYSFDQPPSS